MLFRDLCDPGVAAHSASPAPLPPTVLFPDARDPGICPANKRAVGLAASPVFRQHPGGLFESVRMNVWRPVAVGPIRRSPLHALLAAGIGASRGRARNRSGAATCYTLLAAGSGAALACALASTSVAQQPQGPIPAEQTALAVADPDWRVPRLSWGDPNLEGTFTSRDMSGIPMSRPERFGDREHMTAEEFRQRLSAGPGGLTAQSDARDDAGRLQLSALDSAERGTRTFGYTSYIVEPANGQMPALTEEGRERQAARRTGQANGPFFTTADFSYYDRCISRGVTGSILPSLYGDAMRIVQTPTEVAISYEMLHDTRIIPLDNQPPADAGVRQYMGSSVGHWDGETLVVETANFTDELTVGRMPHSEDLKLTERFTRIDPQMLDYRVTVDDPRTFEAPWTFRLTLTTQPNYEVLEYSCHEGNFFVANALRGEQVHQQRVADARANGQPIPARPAAEGGFSEIYDPPSADEAFDINAGK